jgi:DNA ligase (NAD+)
MGRTGVLTPIAVFEPVEIEGSIVERASMHNVSIMKNLLPHGLASTGMTVGVFKANMIIPQIAYIKDTPNMMGADIIARPLVCPVCGGAVELVRSNDTENYICTNPHCEGKLINKLDHFCGKKGLDIKGLSESTIEKLMNWGWLNSISELFTLKDHRDEWIKQPGFGIKSVDNILTAIENARYCELWQFISALSIPLIGSTYAKEMAKHEPEWFHIREDIDGGYDFTNWDGFGPEMNTSLHKFNYEEADDLVFNKVVILKNSYYKINTGNEELPLDGKVFCITGRLETFKNRSEAKDKIESLGGKVTDSITKNTSYLVNNDVNSTSSKNLSAKKLNIPIITESELTALFGNV